MKRFAAAGLLLGASIACGMQPRALFYDIYLNLWRGQRIVVAEQHFVKNDNLYPVTRVALTTGGEYKVTSFERTSDNCYSFPEPDQRVVNTLKEKIEEYKPRNWPNSK